MTVNVKSEFVSLSSSRSLETKLTDLISCLDTGATVGGTAAANTTAINSAIVDAAATGGFVLVPPGVDYTESSLVMDDSVTLMLFGTEGTVTFLVKDQGSSPIAKGGIAIKSQGITGVILRNVDYGVAAEPFVQVVDATNGDLAAVEYKFGEMTEISDPSAPSANKVRLYCRDNGSGKTQLVARFPTGAVQQVAIEP
jgi:hypothetical protein